MKVVVVGLCVCVLFGSGNVYGQLLSSLMGGSRDKFTSPIDKFNPLHLGSSVGDTVNGLISKIPSLVPSADTIFQVGKNVLAGYPVEAAFKAISLFCKYFSRLYCIRMKQNIDSNVFKS